MARFEGRLALVTGGSSGIGAAVAKKLAEHGATVAVIASQSRVKAVAVVDEIRAAGGKAEPYVVDVRDENAVRALFATVADELGEVDLLVNAAGVFMPSPAGTTSRNDLDRLIDINIKGTWNCIQAAAPSFKQRRRGKILNFASVVGLTGFKGFALYCASKAAIVMMTRVLAAEFAPFGININALAPGNTETPMNEGLRADANLKDTLEGIRRMTPSNTVFSKPEEIASAALYLLSDEARPVHGSTLLIDEGISAAIG